MKYNLHTHSFYCGHGSGKIGEYAEEAERNGFSLLGFSEHCPFPDEFLSRSRMPYSARNAYESDVRALSASFPVLLGYEVDYFPGRKGYYEEVLEDVDYLITGTHYIPRKDGSMVSVFDADLTSSDLSVYADAVIKAMESGLFSFTAHPDVFLSSHPFDEESKAISRAILEAAKDLGMPLELNGNGHLKGRGYPSREFWETAKDMGIPALLSSDAHRVQDLAAPFDFLRSFAEDITLEILEPCSLHPLSFRKEKES